MVMRIGKTEKAWKDLYLQAKREIEDLKAENSRLKQQEYAAHRNIERLASSSGNRPIGF